ncbi:hypothetical protein GGI42DRAFT_328947 [Trichoderma sp. SZMC 28013]
MPPKPGAKQIRKPAPRRRKPSTINLQLAVGQSLDHTATAVNPGATCAMLPPFLAPVVPCSALAPILDAPMAQDYVDPYTRLPPSSSHRYEPSLAFYTSLDPFLISPSSSIFHLRLYQ